MVSVTLPESTYQEAEVIPITSGWKLVGIQEGIRIWETDTVQELTGRKRRRDAKGRFVKDDD